MNMEAKKVMANLPDDWLSLDEIIRSAKQVIKMGRSKHLHIFYHAPTVIIISGKQDAATPILDCSAATQNILLTAELIAIGSCWIGLAKFSFENQENIKKLGIPNGYKQYYAVSLGYKASNKNVAPKRNRNIVNYIK